MSAPVKTIARAGICSALALMVAGPASADEAELRKELDELRRELRELRSDVASRPRPAPVPAAASTPAPAPPAAAAGAGTPTTFTVGGASVTLYGTLNVDAGTVSRTGATAGTAVLNSMVRAPGATPVLLPNRGTLRSNSSNFGLRGSRKLGNGWSAVFQIESALGMDGNASTLGGRDTFVGLASPFGTLLYGGNIDSPYKRGVQERDPFFATGVATQKGILGSPGFNVTSVNAVSGATVGGNAAGAQQQNAGFDARLNNLLIYRSPVLEGFSAEVGYGLNEQKSTSTGVQINPNVWSLQGRYVMGPLFATYSFERRRDVFGLNSLTTLNPGTGVTGAAFTLTADASSVDTGNKLGIGYRSVFDTEVLLVLENLKYTTNQGSVASYDRNAAVVSVAQNFGKHRLAVSYGKAADGQCSLAAGGECSTAGLGAQHVALGYVYTVDPNTSLYLFASKISNEAAAAYNYGVSGAPAAGVGADPSAVALGVRYRF
ncbi:MAG: hypothetical protein C0505_20485 [Leptothrix sp. (in: Bacteria)]|nr:hypothetical protein [Leptothrix sp. (in: b-proteobacteria)]